MPSSSHATDSTTVCTGRLAADGSIQISPYCEASTSAASMNAMLIAKNDLPSTSTTTINQIDNEMYNTDDMKRQKFDHKIDIDDTCSNDAFVFNSNLKGNPLKSNQKTTTVPCTGPK